ncbi:hypothetical protein HDV00_006249 [Rhizophlyctis rosea]|nr:hypothetical protein HDV00_006249 [Rhizophlyctis rosea]
MGDIVAAARRKDTSEVIKLVHLIMKSTSKVVQSYELEEILEFLQTQEGGDVLGAAQAILDHSTNAGLRPSMNVYLSLVKLHIANLTDVKWVPHILDHMEKHGVTPKLPVLGPLFNHAWKLRDVDILETIYHKMCATGVKVRSQQRSAMVYLLVVAGRVEDAEQLHQACLEQKRDGDHGFSASRYISLVRGWMKEGNLQRAKGHVEAMLLNMATARGLKEHEKGAALDTALRLFAQLKDVERIIPLWKDIHTTKHIIKPFVAAQLYASFLASDLDMTLLQPPILDTVQESEMGNFYDVLVRTLIKFGDVAKASAMLDETIQQRHHPTENALSSLLEAYTTADDAEGCERILRLFHQFGYETTTTLYTKIMIVLFNNGQYEAVREIFHQIPSPSVSNYSLIIRASTELSPQTAGETADKLLQEMIASGVPRNERIYAEILRACRYRLDLAEKHFEAMVGEGIMPNAYTYSAITLACAESKDIDKMMEYHHRMVSEGVESNVVVMATVLKGLLNAGKYGMMRTLFDDYRKLGISAAGGITSMMVEAYIKLEDMAGAEAVFEDWLQAVGSGVKEDPGTESGFYIVMDKHAKLGNVERVQYWRRRMDGLGYPATQTSDSILMNAYSYAGDLPAVKGMLGTMGHVGSDLAIFYAIALDACGFHGTAEDATAVFEEGRKRIDTLDVNVYNSYIEALGRHGKADEALAVLYTLLSDGVKPTMKTYGTAMTQIKGKTKEVRAFFMRHFPHSVARNLP